ncbi:MAG: hypothetical protein WBK91_10910 [Alphaproteobacteria bacterium]
MPAQQTRDPYKIAERALATNAIVDIQAAVTELIPVARTGEDKDTTGFLLILTEKLLCSPPDVPTGIDATLVVLEKSAHNPLLMATGAQLISEYIDRLPPEKALKVLYQAARFALVTHHQKPDDASSSMFCLRVTLKTMHQQIKGLKVTLNL